VNLPDDIEVVDANVLIIGGGFAGTWAALRAAELTDGVVLVEKAYVSRAGASVMSGGVTSCPMDDDDLDVWAKEFIVRGGYLAHQAWTNKLLEGQRERIKDLVRWDVPISRDADGTIKRFVSRGMIHARCMQYRPKAAITELRRQIEARGVTIVDRVQIVDLIPADGVFPTGSDVIGAVGFDVRTGRFVAFRAKQTILCTGVIGIKAAVSVVDNDTGDGAAMAYRIGAKLADLEYTFGGTFTLVQKKYRLGSYNVAVAHGARLINARGDRFMEKYDPVRLERGELPLVVAAFAKELVDGRGPCYLDLRHCDASFWDDVRSIGRSGQMFRSSLIPDPKVHPLLIEPRLGIMSADGRGGITVDLACRTSVPGLLAAGACAKNSAIGTHGSAGAPTAWAMVSGWWAGDAAAKASRVVAQPTLPAGALAELRRATFAPLHRTSNLRAGELHERLAQFEEAILDSLMLTGKTLHHRIATVEQVYTDWSEAAAGDLHDLMTLHEARNVAENCRLVYRSALDRTESREQFYREDHPYTDDDEWFCWHLARRTQNGSVFTRRPLPFDDTDLRPAKLPKRLSPIAALMQGTYDPAVYDHVLRAAEVAS